MCFNAESPLKQYDATDVNVDGSSIADNAVFDENMLDPKYVPNDVGNFHSFTFVQLANTLELYKLVSSVLRKSYVPVSPVQY